MLVEPETRQILKNTYLSWVLEKNNISSTDRLRYLGFFEAFLVILGVLQAGAKIQYKQIEYTKYHLGIFRSKKKHFRKETYSEMIIRLVENCLGV